MEKKKVHAVDELYYLSTCNRVLYLFVSEKEVDQKFVSRFLDGQTERFKYFRGEEAILYLFQVASSIHSMVVGEREIITQIRTAYEQQQKWKIAGDNIRLVIQQTVRAAKRVYAETSIGEKPISVVSLGVKKLLELELSTSAGIILVGAGQTNKLVLSHLRKKGFLNISIYNRTEAKAKALASSVKGTVGTIEQLPDHPYEFDCLIACTGATKPTVTLEVAQRMSQQKIDQKIWVDLGLPGDLDPSIQQMYPSQVITLSTLKDLSSTNLSFRKKQIHKANKILQDALNNFKQVIYHRRIEKAFGQIPIQIKDIKNRAIQEIFRNDLEGMDDHTKEIVFKMMDYMEKGCISVPMKAAREASL
jgi:glutamyl-tRNA reductase